MKLSTHCYTALLLTCIGASTATAQSAYSMHTLEAGETLSMLAKTYHTTVGDIMRMNGMNAQSQLHIGEKIKIPASAVEAQAKTTTKTTAPAAAAVPVAKTHVVATGETLYRISQLYKVPVEKLMSLNNLPDGNVKLGQTLLLTDDAELPQQPAKVRTEQNIAASRQVPAQEPQSAPVSPAPAVRNSVPPAASTSQLTAATDNSSSASYADNTLSYSNNTYASVTNAPKEGFFTAMYGKDLQGQRSEQSKSGAAMTFKSPSGWADKKYYILMNDAPTGSIVKVKNGKTELYAKVLWNLGDMKDNDGLQFRISTATAAALGITDQKFDLKVTYFE